MRTLNACLIGISFALASMANADSFSESEEKSFLADKDFPFPPDESALPEETPSIENANPAGANSAKIKKSQVESKKSAPKKENDIFPPN